MPTIDELERAIEIVQDWHGYIESEWGDSAEHDAEQDLLIKLLHAALDRERNEPKTCDGCKHGAGRSSDISFVYCAKCTRQGGRNDRYEPKGEQP